MKMNLTNSSRDRWLTLMECMVIAFLPMIGLGLGYVAMPHGNYILRSVSEGYARSLIILSFGFYAFPAIFAHLALEALQGHGLSASSPSYTFMAVSACIQSFALGGFIWLILGRHQTAAKMLRYVGIATILFLLGNALFGGLVYAAHGPARVAYDRLMTTDHPALLTACRYMISNRDLYTNDWPGAVTLDKGEIGMSQEQIKANTNVPSIIRGMDPICISLEKERVVATLHGPPRLYFIGYAERAEQDGTVRLIDGLWFFNGNWKAEKTTGQPSP